MDVEAREEVCVHLPPGAIEVGSSLLVVLLLEREHAPHEVEHEPAKEEGGAEDVPAPVNGSGRGAP